MYDAECARLAEYFLDGTKADKDAESTEALAQHIQEAIEDWLEEHGL